MQLKNLELVTSSVRQLKIELDGGEGMLFKFNTGDPFIGIESSADFDADGDVDGTDFLNWQRGLGVPPGTGHDRGDANMDTAVNGLDLGVWKSEFGSSTVVPALATVPEPAARLLLAPLAAVLFAGRVYRSPVTRAAGLIDPD
jgi:hypothetical protein